MPTTPSQTVGPFFAIELPYGDGRYAVPEGTPGAVWLCGRVLDGDGAPVPDALVETWQADPSGQFGGDFRGFGRSGTDEEGRWAILTLKPGPGPGGPRGGGPARPPPPPTRARSPRARGGRRGRPLSPSTSPPGGCCPGSPPASTSPTR